MYRLAATVRSGVHSLSLHTPWASPRIKLPTRGGASSLATFKYHLAVSRRCASTNPSDHDSKAIQDIFEGLLLMSLLRYLSVLSLPLSSSQTHNDPAKPRLWTRWPSQTPKDRIGRNRDAHLHAPQLRCPPDPCFRGLSRRSEPR